MLPARAVAVAHPDSHVTRGTCFDARFSHPPCAAVSRFADDRRRERTLEQRERKSRSQRSHGVYPASRCECKEPSCRQCHLCVACACDCHERFQLRFRFEHPCEFVYALLLLFVRRPIPLCRRCISSRLSRLAAGVVLRASWLFPPAEAQETEARSLPSLAGLFLDSNRCFHFDPQPFPRSLSAVRACCTFCSRLRPPSN